MKVYAKIKVLEVTEPQTFKIQKKDVPRSEVVAEIDDSVVALSVWGKEKINLANEALYSGVEKEVVLSITGKKIEKDDGTVLYMNNFTIKHWI